MFVMLYFLGGFKYTCNCLLEECFRHFKTIDFGEFLCSHVSELVNRHGVWEHLLVLIVLLDGLIVALENFVLLTSMLFACKCSTVFSNKVNVSADDLLLLSSTDLCCKLEQLLLG